MPQRKPLESFLEAALTKATTMCTKARVNLLWIKAKYKEDISSEVLTRS